MSMYIYIYMYRERDVDIVSAWIIAADHLSLVPEFVLSHCSALCETLDEVHDTLGHESCTDARSVRTCLLMGSLSHQTWHAMFATGLPVISFIGVCSAFCLLLLVRLSKSRHVSGFRSHLSRQPEQ